jgi:Ger(x)C family germination protein
MIFKRSKIYVLIFVFAFIIYFTQDYTLINIEKTALIVTLGVDKTESDFVVTAQIAVPEGSNSRSTNKEAVLSSSGKTIYEAISSISDKTGWYPKLSFCNLIVLGESMLTENVMDVLLFFIRSYKIEDSAIVCSVKGEAKELLLSSSPLDTISGLSLSKIFVKDYESASKVYTTSIKDFCINYYSRSNYGYMPFVKTVMTDESGKGGKSISTSTTTEPESGSGGNGGKGGSGGQSGGEQQLVIYDATTCHLFNKGYFVCELDGDESLCLSLLYRRVKEAFITINATDNDGNTGDILIDILKSRKSVKLVFLDNIPTLKIDIKIWSRVSDASFSENINQVANLGKLNDNMKFKTESFIKEKIEGILEKSKKYECDIFEVKNLLYKYYPKKYNENYLKILDNLQLKINVTCLNYL